MLWLEKYKPRDFNEMIGHEETINMLKKYDLHSLPHLIIHGMTGSGKKTLTLNLINHLFGTISEPNLRSSQITAGSRTIDVNFLESNEYIEISPADYNFQDKIIIQTIIKEMAQCRPVMSFFQNKKMPPIKIVIIKAAQDLSQEAQAALRRTIEVYSECFRIILICSQISKIIEPIRSRCVFVRVKGFDDYEISEHLKNIIAKEESNINEQEVKDIISLSSGNIRKAICLLELCQLRKIEDSTKRQKIDISRIKLEWEVLIDEIVSIVRRSQKTETMVEVRKKLFLLINSCLPARFILLELYRKFVLKENLSITGKIVDLVLTYEERLRLGTKGIYHIEAFIIGCMCVFNKTM